MNEEYNKVNVKLLSILAYIGPLFLMGKLSVEKDEPHVKFHTHQGAIPVSYTHLTLPTIA